MGDAYTVLARRYRSQTFDELVGQEAIAQTLKNAVKSNRVAHAFLFTGTRGVGKTSAARILAKAINCPNRSADGNPCGVCETCKAIARGDDMDVLEIDGASNNGVDNIRDLRQAAGIRPAKSPYKIYIIDEVHMVTSAAFNALLKTLEEPPEHVKFIFATTDIQKVPATILSRCQRFDFRPIPLERIVNHLQAICRDEKVATDEEAIRQIARLGNGSMRDALSILDRMLSLGEKKITEKMVEDILGRPPTAIIAQLVEALANADAALAITRADGLLKEGMGVEQILSELIEFFRNLMLVATCGDKTDLLDVAADARASYVALARKFDPPALVHMIALCEQTQRSLKASLMHRPLFDALIVRLALSEQFSSLRDLLSSVEKSPANTASQSADKKKSNHDALTPSSVASPAGSDPPAAMASSSPSPQSATEDSIVGSVAEESIYEVMKGHMRRQKEELDARNVQWRQQRGAGAASGRPQAVQPVPAPTIPEKVADPSDLPAVWNAARVYLKTNARLFESVLGGCARVQALDAQTSQVAIVIPAVHKNFANDRVRAKLEEALRAITGLPLRLSLIFDEEVTVAPPAGAAAAAGALPGTQRVPPELLDTIKQQPVVQQLMSRLDARIVHVEIAETEEE